MRQRIITGLVALLIMLLAGCTAARRGKTADGGAPAKEADYISMMRTVADNNITGRGFVIRRGRIELDGTEFDGSFGLNARINSKGDFFISVRGPLGIELVRLLSVGDEIAAIDRFNRTVYIGKKEEVLRKNGMPEDFMEIIFGDFKVSDNHILNPAAGGELMVSTTDENFKREIRICPEEMKVCGERISSVSSGHEITLDFSEFRNSSESRYASLIMMHEKKRMFHVKLTIEELETVYDTDIEFALPSYKRSSL
jgi:Domain of unknown function (DUF4292)